MDKELIREVMHRAAVRFELGGATFNAAGFSVEWKKKTGLGLLDGRMVEAMLRGRSDVVRLYGGSHYRIVG